MKDTAKTSHNIQQAYENKKYIVTRFAVYQPFYSVNAGYYAHIVLKTTEPMIGSGRFVHYTGDQVNRMLGIEHLDNL